MQRAATMLTVAIFLSSCVSSASSLDERLSGKPEKEAKKILAYACYQEAIWPLHHSPAYMSAGARQRSQMDNDPGPEYRELVSLCAKMRTAEGEEEIALARNCEALMDQRSRKYGDKAGDHIRRVRGLCQRFTTQSADVGR